MSFDVAVGMSGAELNTVSAAVYHALYPKVFTGTWQAEFAGATFTIGVDVAAPPVFDLSGVTGQMFTMSLPAAALTLTNGVTTKLTIALTARCQVVSQAGKVSFVPQDVTAAPQPDPVTNYLVEHAVLPAVKNMLTQLLSGVSIPPIQVANVPLSAPAVGVANGYVIATVSLASGPAPSPPDGSFPWPATPFFALLGPALIQQLAVQATQSATNRFSASGSGGSGWAGYSWSYGLSLTNPRSSIQGSGAQLQFTLAGGVSAGFTLIWVPISLAFNANATPDPTANASITIAGGQLVLTATSVNPFTIYVLPGSVPTWIVGWLVTAVINAVVLSLTPLVTTFLKDIRLDSYQIPTYSVTVEGMTLTLTPVNLTIASAGGMIALTGNAAVSHN